MKISTDSIISRDSGIVASEIDGEVVMLSIEKGSYYAMDATGSRIWALMEAPIRVSDLIDALVGTYDVDRQTCERDVIGFLEDLRNDGILRLET